MKDKHVYLRALEPNDYERSILWRKDEELWGLLGGPMYFVSKEYEKEWVWNKIHATDQIILAICEKGSDRYIGNAYLTDLDWINRSCQVHIMIGERSAWNKGYGKETLMLLMEFAFMERGFHRLEAYVLESNIGSRRLFEKCGYKLEGILRERIYKGGVFHNQYVFSIFCEEYKNRNI